MCLYERKPAYKLFEMANLLSGSEIRTLEKIAYAFCHPAEPDCEKILHEIRELCKGGAL